MNWIELNDGNKIPAIGFGTYQVEDKTDFVVKSAIDTGYRLLDGAAIYKNEQGVGLGIKNSSIDRSELFITSKVWNTNRGYENTLNAFNQTITDLGVSYLDLYLIHWPANHLQYDDWETMNQDTWLALETLKSQGKVKSIGVSNFLPHHLESLLKTAKTIPAINQIEYHPGYKQDDVVKFCQTKNIIIEAWRPIAKGDVLRNEILLNIAEKYKKSAAQVCIKWSMQKGIIPLIKSKNPERMKENIDVFDFRLTEDDIQLINTIKPQAFSGLHPDKVTF